MKRFFLWLSLLLFLFSAANAQENILLEDYYHFPLSVGVDAQGTLAFQSPVEDYSFFTYHIESNLKVPFFLNTHIRGLAMAGFQQTLGSLIHSNYFPDYHYDYFQVYGGLGLELAYFVNKHWEAGVTFFAGAGRATFPAILETGPVGSLNVLGEGEIYFAFNPSYNISLRFSPSLRYQHTINGIGQFDGFTIGIGGALDFRMGDDPDLAQRIIRSLKFEDDLIMDVFPAIQATYRQNPLAQFTLLNQEDYPVTDLEVYFYQAGYMDSSTPCLSIEKLLPGEKIDLEIVANFNQNIFNTQGTIPLTGEIIAEYKARGRSVVQKRSMVYNLHDITAIQWDDDRKIAAFITSSNKLIGNYVNQIEKEIQKDFNPYLSRNFQEALAFYTSLSREGCFYQSDPISPFSGLKDELYAIDKVYLPEATLERISGDCDDLTVLFCSMLETAGIQSGFMTYPGHILPVFNTGIHPRDSFDLFPDRSQFIIIEDNLWVPIEITSLGQRDFQSAWSTAVKNYHEFQNKPEKPRIFITREAQKHYQPLGYAQSSETKINFSAKEVNPSFLQAIQAIGQNAASVYSNSLSAKPKVLELNRLGVLYARYNQWEEAKEAFQRALRIQADYMPAMVNLGNLAFIQEDFSHAFDYYNQAQLWYQKNEELDIQKNSDYQNLLIKLALSCESLGQNAEAREWLVQAQELGLPVAGEKQNIKLIVDDLRSSRPESLYSEFLNMWE